MQAMNKPLFINHMPWFACSLSCDWLAGLTGATSTTGPATLRLSVKASPSNEHTAAAVAAADPTRTLALPLAVEPSQQPTSLQLIFDGQPLPTKEVQGEDGLTTVAVLEGVPAGSPSEAQGGARLGLRSRVNCWSPASRASRNLAYFAQAGPAFEMSRLLINATLAAPAYCPLCSRWAAPCAAGRGRRPRCAAGVGQGHRVLPRRRQNLHLDRRLHQAAARLEGRHLQRQDVACARPLMAVLVHQDCPLSTMLPPCCAPFIVCAGPRPLQRGGQRVGALLQQGLPAGAGGSCGGACRACCTGPLGAQVGGWRQEAGAGVGCNWITVAALALSAATFGELGMSLYDPCLPPPTAAWWIS